MLALGETLVSGAVGVDSVGIKRTLLGDAIVVTWRQKLWCKLPFTGIALFLYSSSLRITWKLACKIHWIQ